MKYILTCLFITVSLRILAQPDLPDPNLLDKDPVFRKVLSRRLSYPFHNSEAGYTKLVYAQFSIDEEGHAQNIKILNPAVGRLHFFDFDAVVVKALKKLPPLQPRYEGKYVLPVSFVLNDMHNGKKIMPDNTNFNGRISKSILLRSITVLGYSHKSSANQKTNHMPGTEIYNSTF